MVGGQGIDAGLDIGEVLPEQGRHVGVEAAAFGNGCIGVGSRPRAFAGASARRVGQPPHDHAVTEIPGDLRQLPCPIGEAGGDLREGSGHALSRSGSRCCY